MFRRRTVDSREFYNEFIKADMIETTMEESCSGETQTLSMCEECHDKAIKRMKKNRIWAVFFYAAAILSIVGIVVGSVLDSSISWGAYTAGGLVLALSFSGFGLMIHLSSLKPFEKHIGNILKKKADKNGRLVHSFSVELGEYGPKNEDDLRTRGEFRTNVYKEIYLKYFYRK